MWYNIEATIQIYPDIPQATKLLSLYLEANDQKYLKQVIEKALAQFYEDERIGFARDDEGNLTDDFKQFFKNQVEWHIL